MAVNTTTLVNAVQTKVDAITASCDNKDILLAAVAANRAISAEGHKKVTVATVNDLPNLDTSGVGSGHMVFVESINVPVVSAGQAWYGLDRRQLRKDVPDRRLWTWGRNSWGQLGNGNQTNYSSPITTAGGGTTWKQVAGNSAHTAAIKTDGTLWTWGSNFYGELGNNNTTHRSSPVTTCGGGTNWCFVGCTGGSNTFAIKTDGTLWVWGVNTMGQLGVGDANCRMSPVTTCGGGTNWCHVTGSNGNSGFHSTGIKTDGTLWVWGYNNGGALGTGNFTGYCSPVTTCGGGTNWCQSSGGRYTTIAVKNNGTLWIWGDNQYGQLGTGNTTGYSSPVTTAGGGTNWCAVAGGYLVNFAIKTDGTLWSWGRGNGGALGTGNTTNQSSPVTTAGGGTNWCVVTSGGYHSSGLKTDGTLWSWGSGGYGQLGTGNTTDRSSPVTTAGGGTNWCQVSNGQHHTLAIAVTL